MKLRTTKQQIAIVEELAGQVLPPHVDYTVKNGGDNTVFVLNRTTRRHVYIQNSETPMSIVRKLRDRIA